MRVRLGTAAVLSLALAVGESVAQPATAAMPATNMCAEKVSLPGFIAAVPTSRPSPAFPEAEIADESEGWVRVGFAIDKSGDTKDIVILDRVGPQSMARAARLAVARWKYNPATEGGVAVEQYGNNAELLFRDKRIGNTAIHTPVVTKFDEARGLVSSAKYAEGIAVLEQALELPATLYERAKVAFALAFAFEKSNDMPRALTHVRHALLERGTFLEKAVVPAAQRLRIRLEVANGNLHYAACAPPLPATDSFDPTGADLKATATVVSTTKANLASPSPLTVDAALVADPGTGKGGVWEHSLVRRKFKFAALVGELDDFKMTCVRQLANGEVNDTTQWEVPRDAGPCVLRVYGEVGAAFKLTEEW